LMKKIIFLSTRCMQFIRNREQKRFRKCALS
jgi:hypothetical protein